MEGKNIRYVVSYINRDGMRRRLKGNTLSTRDLAKEALKAVLENNTRELLIETFGEVAYETLDVSAIDCWEQNDPKGIYIDEELNPGQEMFRGEIKDMMKRLK
jgi:hypothetical protein